MSDISTTHQSFDHLSPKLARPSHPRSEQRVYFFRLELVGRDGGRQGHAEYVSRS